MTKAPPLILLKSPSTPDKYAAFFDALGAPVPDTISPLKTTYLDDAIAGATALFSAEPFWAACSGVILTSQHAAECLGRALAAAHLPVPERPLRIFAVGPATAAAARQVCSTVGCRANVLGEESGTGAALARVVLNHVGERGELLHLVGEKHDPAIKEELHRAKVTVQVRVLYKTELDPGLAEKIESAVARAEQSAGSHAVCIVAFAPSGLRGLFAALGWLEQGKYSPDRRRAWQSIHRLVKVFAIGPTTARHARELGFDVDGVAKDPTPQGVWACIQDNM